MIQAGVIEKSLGGALIGAIFGGSYGLIRTFLSRPGFLERLNPKPECFHMDAKIPKAFFDLAKYRHLDEQAYVEALHNFDSLLCLEEQLQLKEVEPQITDPPSATQLAVRGLTHFRSILDKVTEEAEYDEIMEIIKTLEQIAEDHVSNIEKICKLATT